MALLVFGDGSVVYQCEIQRYNDTLYTQANRQFYDDTDISGTLDFICGNSAVVFQNCGIMEQGRNDRNQNTGISIQKCRITGVVVPGPPVAEVRTGGGDGERPGRLCRGGGVAGVVGSVRVEHAVLRRVRQHRAGPGATTNNRRPSTGDPP